jgi:hypothetical protein
VTAALGLFEAEVDKWLVRRECQQRVRAENLRAFEAL